MNQPRPPTTRPHTTRPPITRPYTTRPFATQPYTRRAALSLGGGALASFLAACATNPTSSIGPRRRSTLGRGSFELRMWNWPSYIDGATIESLKSEGLNVTYTDTLEDNALVTDALASGDIKNYDVVTPTYWLAKRMIERGEVEPLPIDQIPNHVNLDTAFLRPSWDRGARFHMPWQSAITGIAYNRERHPEGITSVGGLLSLATSTPIALLSEMRDTIAFAVLAAKGDPSQITGTSANKALQRLAQLPQANVTYTGNEYVALLREGKVNACMAWSGDIAQLQQEAGGSKFGFAIPEEGGMQFFDTMVIPNGSPNGDAAAKFIDFVYNPVNAARITAEVQYISPVIGVRDELRRLGGDAAKLADNELLFPSDETRQRLFTWGGLSAADEDMLQTEFSKLAPA
jgi:spermidine/putrescine transport system substrate-binding protein